MTEEVKASPAEEAKPITPPTLGNDMANRAREAIIEKFDAQSESSSEIEESTPDKDSKEKSDTDLGSGKPEETKTEKPTSESKGEETNQDDGGQKKVPLQALQESRERFKKLNLDSRQYKESTDKEITSLKEQVDKLSQLLKAPQQDSTDDYPETDREKLLRQQLEEFRAQSKTTSENGKAEAMAKAQKEYQDKVQRVTQELSEEGFPGFDFAIAKTSVVLKNLVDSGELTQEEWNDPSVWKQVFKDEVYEDMQKVLTKQDKTDVMAVKTEAKKKAQLIADPGKAPEKEEAKKDEPESYDSFVKSTINERLTEKRKRRT